MPASEIPKRVIPLLTRTYAALKRANIRHDGQNVFVYWPAPDGLVDVDAGVGVYAPFAPTDELTYVETPAGVAATATHWRDYQLAGVHEAIRAWVAKHSREMAGASWEVYGHWSDDPAQVRTDVFYLLKPA
jgi:hypothetical protein